MNKIINGDCLEVLKVFEMFAGYGGASFALKREGIEHEIVGYSEIDKFAIQCYEQNHKGKNFGDCTKINPNELPDFDLLTGGFPCQSFSAAGKGLGEQDTRGTLFHEIIRIAEVKKPKYILLENVKGLTFKPHKATFEKILSELDRIGYNVIWKVLNSKEYGIPQNRERVWFVCFRKDIKNNFEFPQKEELKIFLKDILEDEVDEKYFLSEKQTKRLVEKSRSFNERFCKKEFSPTLCSRDYKDPKIIQVNNPKHSKDRIYSEDGISPTINTMNGGNLQPFILRGRPKMPYEKGKRELEYKEYNKICPTISQNCASGDQKNIVVEPFIVASRGRNPNNPSERIKGGLTEQRIEPKFDGTTNTITSVQKDNWVYFEKQLRKLTPEECFRLMGFLNDEINLNGLSNTQKYKLAGNGWEINIVGKLLNNLMESKWGKNK